MAARPHPRHGDCYLPPPAARARTRLFARKFCTGLECSEAWAPVVVSWKCRIGCSRSQPQHCSSWFQIAGCTRTMFSLRYAADSPSSLLFPLSLRHETSVSMLFCCCLATTVTRLSYSRVYRFLYSEELPLRTVDPGTVLKPPESERSTEAISSLVYSKG